MEKELSTANNQSLMDCTNNPDRDHSYAKKNDHAKQEKKAKLSMKVIFLIYNKMKIMFTCSWLQVL
jgi:hypothetical protein